MIIGIGPQYFSGLSKNKVESCFRGKSRVLEFVTAISCVAPRADGGGSL